MHASLEGLKVITAQEMGRIEALAYTEGASEQTFMENAGAAVAEAVLTFLTERRLPKVVSLLVGKGNNGGDAYAAGARLIERGIKTVAFPIYALDDCGALCKKMHDKFRSMGGVVHSLYGKPFAVEREGIILDGLVGTGFHGKAEGVLAQAIEHANRTGLPIVAIDIPSGLNGTTGEVETVAIHAAETISLGLPKIGFFLKQGWDHVGSLKHAHFGLGKKYIADAKAVAYLLDEEQISHLFPPIKRTRHKYESGYVLSIAGSPHMPGAALLASFAALRAGAGIVRLFHRGEMHAELGAAPWELIREEWNGKDFKLISKEAARAKAILMGPGIGRTKEAKNMVYKALKSLELPMVLDADALYFLAENPNWKLPAHCILTPHRGEMHSLLESFKLKKKEELQEFAVCQAYAQEKQATIVLKGAPTFIFHPGATPLIITRGDPGMATAGSGDVLTGIIAGLLAQGLEPRTAAALSVYLHGYAGEMVAQSLTSYCMVASDLIKFLPKAFKDHLTF